MTEINPSLEATPASIFDLRLDELSAQYLLEAAKWARFLSILGFIFVGLVLLAGIFAGTFLSYLSSSTPGLDSFATMGGGVVIALYVIIIDVIYFFPILFLYRFSSKTINSIKRNDQINIAEAFRNLKSHYKYVGVLAIIFLALYALIFVIGILGVMMR